MNDQKKAELKDKLAHVEDGIAAYQAGVNHHGHKPNPARIADLQRQRQLLKEQLGEGSPGEPKDSAPAK